MTWSALLEQWKLLEADLQDAGVDVGDDDLMESRSWRWFTTKVEGVLSRPPVAFVQTADPTDNARVTNQPVFGSRLQQHFFGAREG